jgi:hypothetical protein
VGHVSEEPLDNQLRNNESDHSAQRQPSHIVKRDLSQIPQRVHHGCGPESRSIISPWLLGGTTTAAALSNVLVGVALILLRIRRGPVRESYGIWNRYIM